MQVKVDELWWLWKKKIVNPFFFKHFFLIIFLKFKIFVSIFFLWKALRPVKVLKKTVCEYLFVKKTAARKSAARKLAAAAAPVNCYPCLKCKRVHNMRTFWDCEIETASIWKNVM